MKEQIEVLKQTELLGQQFKVYGTPQEPLFLAKDIARLIKHSDVSMMLQNIDNDEKLIQGLFVSGQKRDVWMLTENGLYEVLMQSRKPIAKEFKKGVKSILKEIRTNGGYMVAKQDETPEQIMARALILANQTIERSKQQLQIANSTIKEQENEIKKLAPKAQYTDEVLQSNSTYTLTQVAHDLGLRSVHVLIAELIQRKILF